MSASKYKVEDKVKVREDLKKGGKYGRYSFVYKMARLKGEVVTISWVGADCYRVKGNDYNWTDEMFEGKVENMFTKDDLKTGMVVTCRNGEKFIVMRNCCCMKGEPCDVLAGCDSYDNGWLSLKRFNNDLLCRPTSDYDIIRVEELKSTTFGRLCKEYQEGFFTVIWERSKEINLKVAIVKHDGVDKEYWFEAPEVSFISKGDVMLVDTAQGKDIATVKQVLFFKMQADLDDYIEVNNISGPRFPLKKVIGVVNKF